MVHGMLVIYGMSFYYLSHIYGYPLIEFWIAIIRFKIMDIQKYSIIFDTHTAMEQTEQNFILLSVLSPIACGISMDIQKSAVICDIHKLNYGYLYIKFGYPLFSLLILKNTTEFWMSKIQIMDLIIHDSIYG